MGNRTARLKRNKNMRLTAAICIMLLLICLCIFFLATQARKNKEERTIDNVESSETNIAVVESIETILFASDYQEMNGWDTPSVTLSDILSQIKNANKSPTNVIFCGDYTNDRNLHDYQLKPDDSINEIRDIVGRECTAVSQDDMIFVQGNHDQLTDAISPTGLHEYDNYLVYVLNTQYEFPWKQGRDIEFRDRVVAASGEMKKCFDELISQGETRPMIIAGHVPLHFTARTTSRHNTGDNMYASYVFDVVNEAGESLDIIYLFGHNHSKGWDCYIGGASVFKEPGEEVLIPDPGNNTSYADEFITRKLTFTYMNAGYTGYYMNCGPEELDNGTVENYTASDETLTATICEVFPDELVITRFSTDGKHPLCWDGEGNPYKNGIDEGLISSEFYSKQVESSTHIVRRHTDIN